MQNTAILANVRLGNQFEGVECLFKGEVKYLVKENKEYKWSVAGYLVKENNEWQGYLVNKTTMNKN